MSVLKTLTEGIVERDLAHGKELVFSKVSLLTISVSQCLVCLKTKQNNS
jgi:hypothetical protein